MKKKIPIHVPISDRIEDKDISPSVKELRGIAKLPADFDVRENTLIFDGKIFLKL